MGGRARRQARRAAGHTWQLAAAAAAVRALEELAVRWHEVPIVPCVGRYSSIWQWIIVRFPLADCGRGCCCRSPLLSRVFLQREGQGTAAAERSRHTD